MLVFDFDQEEKMLFRTFLGARPPNAFIRAVTPNIATRLILVEDMSPSIIESLGSALEIRPEAFEAHLRESGYEYERTRGFSEDSSQSHMWRRFDSSQLYDSFTWFRPVLPTLSISDRKYKDIWADRNPRLPCLYPSCAVGRDHRVATKRNILRNRFHLSILHDAATADTFPIGWEERITIWKRKIGHCRFGTSEISFPITKLNSLVVVFLDPLPTLYYHGRLIPPPRDPPDPPGMRTIFVQSEAQPIHSTEIPDPLFPNPRPSRRDGHFETGHLDPRWPIYPHDHFVPFRSVSFRSNVDALQEEAFDRIDTDVIQSTLRPPTSSLEAFEILIEESRSSSAVSHLGEMVLRILYGDITILNQIMRSSLEDLRAEMVNISIPQLQRQSLQWRSTLGRFHFNVQKLIDNIPRFVDFMHRSDVGKVHLEASAKELSESIIAQLKETNEHVDRTYNALRTELQIADTRKSIEEAESVAKLTELAFVFIPLTFAAGLFSMQVKELQSSPPTVSVFVGTSFALLCSAYLVRLAVRSDMLLNPTRSLLHQAREHANLPEGDSITTRQFLRFIAIKLQHSMWTFVLWFDSILPYLGMALIILVLLVPLIFFWRKGLPAGYVAVISIMIILMDATLVWVLIKFVIDKDAEDAGTRTVTWIFTRKRAPHSESEDEERVSTDSDEEQIA